MKIDNMSFDFKGKTAVITGASRGIGLSIANAFLESGAEVVNISRTKKNPKNSLKYTFVKGDITNLNSIKLWVEKFTAKGRQIDFWINNAGIYTQSELSDVNEADWNKTFDINLKSLFFLSKYAADHMKLNGGGVIINAASFAGYMPSVGSGIYAASKAAVISLTKSMAAEWAPYGIRVNSYCPGVILTDMTKEFISQKKKNLLESIALSRFGEPEEVAQLVLFLCSDSASYITGQNIKITGGKFLAQNQSDAYKK